MKGLGIRAKGLGFACASLTLAVFAWLAPAPLAQQATPFRIEPLTSPAGDDTLAPNLVTEGTRTVLSWLDTHDDLPALKFSERTATGWSEPRTVISNESLMVNPADVPVVRPLPGGTLVAAWLEVNSDDGEAYDLKVARSTDSGRTWSRPVTPHHDGTKTQHGFASIVPASGGGFLIVWLDGRATNPAARTPAEAGSMTLRSAEFDASGTERGESLIDARVCDCCPLSMAATAAGPLVVFRDRSPEEIRDIAVSRLSAGKWTPSAVVHRDGWKIEGCPVNGPSVTADGGAVAAAWFTGATGSGRAFAAFSKDSGVSFGSAVRVDDNEAVGRVQIQLLTDGAAAVLWVESPRSQLRIRRIDSTGARSPSLLIGEGMGSSHPRMSKDRDGLIFAWADSSGSTTRIRTARASLAR
jgi:hypothetical protein